MNTQKNMIKMILLSLLIAAVNIFCFSKAGLGLSFFSPSVFQKSLSITVLLMSIGVFGYAGFHLLIKEEPVQEEIQEEEVLEDETESSAVRYLRKMKESLKTRSFAFAEVEKASLQYEEFLRKKKSLEDLIEIHETQNAAKSLISTLDDAETTLANNFRLMLTRLVILDYDDETRYETGYRGYMKARLQKNEEILNLLDAFLDEVSRMKDGIDMENTNLQTTIDVLRQMRSEYEEDSNGFTGLFDGVDANRTKLAWEENGKAHAIYVDEQTPGGISQTYPPQN